MSAETIVRQTVLETVTCYSCGVLFAMPDNLMRRLRDTGADFWCPSGHGQKFTRTTAQKLEEERVARLQERERWQTRVKAAQDQADATERSNRALRGVNTRMKRRVAAGVCPCCRRTFQDLARHMTGQHPTFGEDGAA
jgi:hypothetical protein